MINLREIRISILYFFYVVATILVILFLKKSHLLSGMKDNFLVGIFSMFLAFSIIAAIPFIIVSIIHLIKAFKYKKVYYSDKHYAEWYYSKNEWISFITNNFRKFNEIEMKAFKMSVVFWIIVIPVILLIVFLKKNKDTSHMSMYLLSVLTMFFMFEVIPILVRVRKLIDHILFTNRSVILMRDIVIINGEIFKFDNPEGKEIIKKQIRGGNVEIHYVLPARFLERYFSYNIRKLIIPIPTGKYKEAETYIKAPLPFISDRYVYK